MDFKEYSELFHAGVFQRAKKAMNDAGVGDKSTYRYVYNNGSSIPKREGTWRSMRNTLINKYGNPNEMVGSFKFNSEEDRRLANQLENYIKNNESKWREEMRQKDIEDAYQYKNRKNTNPRPRRWR